MKSEFGQRLSLEELKQRNQFQAIQTPPQPPASPTQQDLEDFMAALTALYQMEKTNSGGLERLEASVGAQAALLRGLTRQVGQLPTQTQLEVLGRDVAQIRAEMKRAGKKRERRFSLPRIRLPKLYLPYISWSRLLLGLTALVLTGSVLWAVWFSWEKLWSAVQALIP